MNKMWPSGIASIYTLLILTMRGLWLADNVPRITKGSLSVLTSTRMALTNSSSLVETTSWTLMARPLAISRALTKLTVSPRIGVKRPLTNDNVTGATLYLLTTPLYVIFIALIRPAI